MASASVVKPLHEKIDERRKLSLQVFAEGQYLVLNGAGGGVACAAHFAIDDSPDLVVDQTLYWSLVTTEDEAWFRVGLMNTDALTAAIREFNPEGELGPRHLHTLPNRILPTFEPANAHHTEIAGLAQDLAVIARDIADANDRVARPERPIASRRRTLREHLRQCDEFVALESAAAAALGLRG